MISAFQEMCINAGLLHVPDGKTNDMEIKAYGKRFYQKKRTSSHDNIKNERTTCILLKKESTYGVTKR